MRDYLARVQLLKNITDGNRTYWYCESTVGVRRGREREFADLVGRGVYDAGFAALRAYLGL